MNHNFIITPYNPGRMTVNILFLSHPLPTSLPSEPQISEVYSNVTLTLRLRLIVSKYHCQETMKTHHKTLVYVHVVTLMYGLFTLDRGAACAGSPAGISR